MKKGRPASEQQQRPWRTSDGHERPPRRAAPAAPTCVRPAGAASSARHDQRWRSAGRPARSARGCAVVAMGEQQARRARMLRHSVSDVAQTTPGPGVSGTTRACLQLPCRRAATASRFIDPGAVELRAAAAPRRRSASASSSAVSSSVAVAPVLRRGRARPAPAPATRSSGVRGDAGVPRHGGAVAADRSAGVTAPDTATRRAARPAGLDDRASRLRRLQLPS